MPDDPTTPSEPTTTLREPTALQAETLVWIREFIEREGMPPTIRELCAHFGVKSSNAMSDRLRAMRKKGLLRNTPKSARSWRPT